MLFHEHPFHRLPSAALVDSREESPPVSSFYLDTANAKRRREGSCCALKMRAMNM